MPSDRSSAASPTPDSMRSLALPTPPADRITSREAPILCCWPSMSNSTPEQRVPVKVSLVTGVFVSSVRFGRDRLGLDGVGWHNTLLISAAMAARVTCCSPPTNSRAAHGLRHRATSSLVTGVSTIGRLINADATPKNTDSHQTTS